MRKKRKQNYFTKKYLISTVILLAIIVFLTNSLENDQKENHNIKLKNNFFVVLAIVEKLKEDVRYGKNRISRRDVVYFYFIKNDSVFHRIHYLSDNFIEKNNIRLNDCFEVKVSKEDYETFEIDFTKAIDTFVDKERYEHHIYYTNRHKNFLE